MGSLIIRVLEAAPTPAGVQGYCQIVEPNGDIHLVRCLCRQDATSEVGESEDKSMLEYLRGRYGPELVPRLRQAVIRAASLGPDSLSL